VFEIIEVEQCQHADIRDCPLYAASHDVGGGCAFGELERGCAVARGDRQYAPLVADLRWTQRAWFAEWRNHVEARQSRELYERNRQLNR
jgi:hypothetical protein